MQSSKPKTTTQQTEQELDIFECECCEPKRNLVPRPDLGGFASDGQHALIALCVLHRPISVYTWDESQQKYVWRQDLKFENNQVVDDKGQVFAQRQITPRPVSLDTDDEAQGGPGPQSGTRVNLERDEFY